MHKAKISGRDPDLAILDHSNTPSQGLNASPAQRLLSRRTRTLLPPHNNLLKPKVVDTRQELRLNQRRQEMYYNRHAKDINILKLGDQVRVQPAMLQKIWQKATVLEAVNNQSYKVELDKGGVLRRNRRHLRHTGRQEQATKVGPPANNIKPKEQCVQSNGDTKPIVTTRAGWISVRPQYLKEYVA